MKNKSEMVYEFMLALVTNDSFCMGAEDDPKFIYDYAVQMVNVFLANNRHEI